MHLALLYEMVPLPVKKRKKKNRWTPIFKLLVAILQEFHAAVNIIRAMVALGHYYMAVCLSFMDQLRTTIPNTSHIFLAWKVRLW